MAKDIQFEVLPGVTGKVSEKYSRVSFRRGVSGDMHTYCYRSDRNQHQSDLQKEHSSQFAKRMAIAKEIMGDDVQREVWQARFEKARKSRQTKYHRLQQFIAFSVEI